MNILNKIYILIPLILWGIHLKAQTPPTEDDYYSIVTLPIPEGIVLEVGGLTTLPNGNIAAATRRGDVYIVENPYMANRSNPYYRHFASGLHEALGLSYKDGTYYVAQRGELTRLWDKNGDKKADFYESVYAWPVSGHYHEYSYGPVIAGDGSMYVTGNVAFGDQEWWRGESRVPWRGWMMKISPEGEMEPWATGMRSPCGIGMIGDDVFYTDNQGDWQVSGALFHVEKGDFTGHPAGLRWSERAESPVKLKTEDLYALADPMFTPEGEKLFKPENDASQKIQPFFELKEKLPSIKPPAVWLPHTILGISTSQLLTDETGGNFGPFDGQLFIGDEGQSKIVRVSLEKVNGVYQGAAFGFREGFQSGVLRMTWGKDGSLFVGQSNRGWGSTGPKPFGLQRLVWTGKTPFEMKTVKAMPDGFEIEFTQPVDKTTAANPDNYKITGFVYKYHPVYGSPVVNDENCFVKGVKVSRDGLKVRLVVDNLRQYYVHEINAVGVRDYYDKNRLLHSTAYYTLNEIPEGEKLDIPLRTEKKMPAHDHSEAKPVEKKAASKTVKKATSSVKLKKHQTTLPSSWKNGPDQTIVIGTKPGLKFNKTDITVKSGSKIRWTFSNNDDMPHNFVLVAPGQADAVGDAALELGLKGMDMGYVPNSSKILNHTKLLNPGVSESLYFVAPKPGIYTFVCTFPGHAQIMRGTLRVVE